MVKVQINSHRLHTCLPPCRSVANVEFNDSANIRALAGKLIAMAATVIFLNTFMITKQLLCLQGAC